MMEKAEREEMEKAEKTIGVEKTAKAEKMIGVEETAKAEKTVGAVEATEAAGRAGIDNMPEIPEEKYCVVGKLGKGGTGNVYKVYDRHLKCEMAMKEFYMAEDLPQRELEMMKKLKHPAFPVITDYMEKGDYRYLVMEYIDGMSLEEYVKERGSIGQEQAVSFAMELADVLIYLHEWDRPVIYGDMKPANIMIDGKGKVRLVDFGTACFRYDGEEAGAGKGKCAEKHTGAEAGGCTGKYIGAGTPGYGAPEQFEDPGGERKDERSDIYGLGMTVVYMLTGRKPSEFVCCGQPLGFYRGGLSEGIEKIVNKATQKEKENRYQSVRQMKAALEKCRYADRRREVLLRGTELLYYVLLLAAGGSFFMWYAKAETAGMEKISEEAVRAFIFAVLIFSLCLGKAAAGKWRKRTFSGMRLEKSILLTEKKGKGLQILFFSMLFTACMGSISVAAKEGGGLVVHVRNEAGQKVLIRYDAVYGVKDTLKLELPADNFREGSRYELKLECVDCGTKEKRSRIFYLKGLEP